MSSRTYTQSFFSNIFNIADVACLFFYVSFLQGLTGARGYPGFPVGGCAFFDLIILVLFFPHLSLSLFTRLLYLSSSLKENSLLSSLVYDFRLLVLLQRLPCWPNQY